MIRDFIEFLNSCFKTRGEGEGEERRECDTWKGRSRFSKADHVQRFHENA
jgi:hypothetical protein